MTNALVVYVRAAAIDPEGARATLRTLLALPFSVVSLRELMETALEVAQARGLSAYDACYAALAEASRAALVTADAKLAAAVPRAVLLPDAGPAA